MIPIETIHPLAGEILLHRQLPGLPVGTDAEQALSIMVQPRAATTIRLHPQPIKPAREHPAAGLGFQNPLPSPGFAHPLVRDGPDLAFGRDVEKGDVERGLAVGRGHRQEMLVFPNRNLLFRAHPDAPLRICSEAIDGLSLQAVLWHRFKPGTREPPQVLIPAPAPEAAAAVLGA